ncbi:HIT family protein [Yinghuangia soli]|uniref:HIT domain-containing protein n=1 Tax=Yinghuangia soli TaxID=2908204 RepID=A0AA41PVT2_9ACTN|nr:HIT domain-containing protein [Yinghuangia soli]MCF2526616.1 HIT domain-containing protein [Yinghuangia soli]
MGSSQERQNCAFCAIASGAAPAAIVFEAEDSVGFLPLNPATFGHTLIIPRRHFRDLWEIPKDVMADLMKSALVVAHGIRDALRPEGMNIINSAGEVASQTIFHIHVHLVPRWQDDRMGRLWPPDEPQDEAARRETARRIAEYIAI